MNVMIATARVLPKSCLGKARILDTRNHITDNDIFPSSDFGPFWSILGIIAHMVSQVIAIFTDTEQSTIV